MKSLQKNAANHKHNGTRLVKIVFGYFVQNHDWMTDQLNYLNLKRILLGFYIVMSRRCRGCENVNCLIQCFLV